MNADLIVFFWFSFLLLTSLAFLFLTLYIIIEKRPQWVDSILNFWERF